LEGDGNVAGLIAELSNPLAAGRYSIVRGHAALALGGLADPRALEGLIALSKDDSDIVRMNALDALGSLGDHQAVPTLMAGLDDPAPLPCVPAAESLGRLNAVEATPQLRALAQGDPDPEMRLYATEALVALGDTSVSGLIAGVLAAIPARTRRMKRWQRLLEHTGPS
jgi:HEAT repeat protein